MATPPFAITISDRCPARLVRASDRGVADQSGVFGLAGAWGIVISGQEFRAQYSVQTDFIQV